jgi:hypothetical protein
MIDDNDGRFPDESPVLVRYPLPPFSKQRPGQSDAERLAELAAERKTWPWLAGTIEQQCGRRVEDHDRGPAARRARLHRPRCPQTGAASSVAPAGELAAIGVS